MTVLDIILIVCLSILAVGVLILAIRGKFSITVERRITTKKELDPLQLKIMEANLEELKRYNNNAEKAAEEHTETMKTLAEGIQTALGVMDESSK